MKNIVALLVALLIMIAFNVLNKYALNFEIPQFFIGWICCVGFSVVQSNYSDEKRIQTNNLKELIAREVENAKYANHNCTATAERIIEIVKSHDTTEIHK